MRILSRNMGVTNPTFSRNWESCAHNKVFFFHLLILPTDREKKVNDYNEKGFAFGEVLFGLLSTFLHYIGCLIPSTIFMEKYKISIYIYNISLLGTTFIGSGNLQVSYFQGGFGHFLN